MEPQQAVHEEWDGQPIRIYSWLLYCRACGARMEVPAVPDDPPLALIGLPTAQEWAAGHIGPFLRKPQMHVHL